MGKDLIRGVHKRNKISIARQRTVRKKNEITNICRSIVEEIVENAINASTHKTCHDNDTHQTNSDDEYDFPSFMNSEEYMSSVQIEGYRFVEMDYCFKKALSLQSLHNLKCTGGKLEYFSETRSGLVSVYTLKCNMCDCEEHLATEKPQTSEEKSNNHSTINTAAVWGTLSIDGSYTHLTELLSVMNVPPLGGTVFFEIQRELDDAVIIGKRTGKILFLGIRNKYCSICARNEHKSLSNGTHVCFKNCDGPSASMEADIVIGGFDSSKIEC
ncbi:hypothetical protein ILUMI_16441, partial [Ignelater luminosus]